VLVKPGEGEDRTKVGLYLPATAVDSQAVQTGKVVAVGPGTPIGAPADLNEEPWKIGASEPRYLPVQAEVGDFAIFFRKAAVEITFESEKYLVVPQAAILGAGEDGRGGRRVRRRRGLRVPGVPRRSCPVTAIASVPAPGRDAEGPTRPSAGPWGR
jgi:chaperonin GroES